MRKLITDAGKEAYLTELREGKTHAEAARAGGADRRSFFDERQRDEAFGRSVKEAEHEGTEILMAEARRRGVEGWDEVHVSNKGEQYVVRRYSDRLLEFVLKARDPSLREGRSGQLSIAANGEQNILAVRWSFDPSPEALDTPAVLELERGDEGA